MAVCQTVEREVQRGSEGTIGGPYTVHGTGPRLGECIVAAHEPHVLEDEPGEVQRLVDPKGIRATRRVLATELEL